MLRPLLVLVVLAVAALSHAGVEKTAFVCDQKVCLRWWPRVSPPAGWSQDREQSANYNFCAFAPEGQSFANAVAVMYANAIFKARVPEAGSLREFIDQDLERFRSDAAGLKIGAAPKMRTADGKSVESHWLAPAERGQWERVAYFEEGDYYMAFVVSSRTEQGLLDAMPAFEELVGGYRE